MTGPFDNDESYEIDPETWYGPLHEPEPLDPLNPNFGENLTQLLDRYVASVLPDPEVEAYWSEQDAKREERAEFEEQDAIQQGEARKHEIVAEFVKKMGLGSLEYHEAISAQAETHLSNMTNELRRQGVDLDRLGQTEREALVFHAVNLAAHEAKEFQIGDKAIQRAGLPKNASSLVSDETKYALLQNGHSPTAPPTNQERFERNGENDPYQSRASQAYAAGMTAFGLGRPGAVQPRDPETGRYLPYDERGGNYPALQRAKERLWLPMEENK
jgi:hypothetical protein